MTHIKTIFTILPFLVLLTACEPPTLAPLSTPIPNYTQDSKLKNWSSKISTFNVWALPVISQLKDERMPAIGNAIAARQLDAAILQEAWQSEWRNHIRSRSAYQFSKSFTVKNTLGSGLMILSHSPIDASAFRPFQLFGPIYLPDAWAVKGVGISTTTIKELPVSLISTHLMAGLSRKDQSKSPFTVEWKMEMFEVMAHVIEQTQSDAFVIGGDFNIGWGDEEYEYWKRLSNLEGTYLEEHSGECTWCKGDNSWAEGASRQIDYIFVSPRLKIQHAEIDFKEKIPVKNKMVSLSDHYGVTAQVAINSNMNFTKTSHHVRESFTLALAELYFELIAAKALFKKIESEGLQPAGWDERVCHSCRVEIAQKQVESYLEALSEHPTTSPLNESIRIRLNSFFSLWKN